MKGLFGVLLFICGVVELVLTIAAIAAGGFQTVFFVSFIISFVLLGAGALLNYEVYEEEFS